MRYTIVKFESDYGPPLYRVRLHRFLWVSWLKGSGGHVLNFETKEKAHEQMRSPAKATREAASQPLAVTAQRI